MKELREHLFSAVGARVSVHGFHPVKARQSFGGDIRWKVAAEGDIQVVAVAIAVEFRRVGLPYQRLEPLETLYALLRDNGPEGRRHSPFPIPH